jgi:hypothetical protein
MKAAQILLLLLLVAIGVLFAQQMPEIRRYMKVRSM